MKKTTKPRVTSITFGDGYVQRTQRGLNPFDDSYSLTFVNSPNSTASDIILFFEDHLGYLPFKWTPLGTSVEILVICSEWDVVTDNHITKTINATFTRTYDPSA
jgi:phage-related protein